jgi:hypothetical protein
MYSRTETIDDPHEITRNMKEETLASKELKFASVRLEFLEDGKISKIVNGGTEWKYPPPSATLERLIAEKIALLKLAPMGKALKKVGRRHSETVYYIRIFPEDMARMEKLFIRGALHEV